MKKIKNINPEHKLPRPLVIVSIRYSVLLKNKSPWNISRGRSAEDYRSALFNDERISTHFHLFSTLTLPSLVNQIPQLDPEFFRLYISISEALPEKNKSQLIELVKDIPWVRIKEIPTSARSIPHSDHIAEFFRERSDDLSVYAHVRLDDDDALAKDFVARISDYATNQNVGRVISLGRGIMANFDVKERKFIGFRQMHYPKVAMGMTLIGIRNQKSESELGNIYSIGDHTKVDLVVPTIIDSRNISYIRTMHSLSDTQSRNTSGAMNEIDIDEVRKYFTFL